MTHRPPLERRPSPPGAWSIIAWLLLVGLLAWSLWFFWAVWLPARSGTGCVDAGRPACHAGSTPGWVTGLRWGSWILALIGTLATFAIARRYVAGAASAATMRTSLAVSVFALVGLAASLLALP
jgi:hypothetical protein